MAHHMKVCERCSQYSLDESCSHCGEATKSCHPPKYSKEDKYALYRRKELFPEFFTNSH